MTDTMPATATGLPASILSFPADRTRAPGADYGLYDRMTLDRCFVAARVASQYRDLSPARAQATVVEIINDRGAEVIARVLEENATAIVTLRAVLASLIEADWRIMAAAALAMEGL